MRSTIRTSSQTVHACFSCAVALKRAFAACRFCRTRYHLDCSEWLEGCEVEGCEGQDLGEEAFDVVDRSPLVQIADCEPRKAWYVRHKEALVYLGLFGGVTAVQQLGLERWPLVSLGLFGALIVGAIAFTLLTPRADD